MQHKKLKLSAVLLLSLGLTGIQAQEAITATGGDGSGSGGSVSYTVGQAVYSTYTGSNGSVAEGVQQPYEISVVTAVEDAKLISLEFVVYPNPASDYVILKTGSYEIENLRYYLYDLRGNLLDDDKIQSSETNISLQTYMPSTYFLKVVEKNRVLKIFKIIKNH
jgi:hypothetical protein